MNPEKKATIIHGRIFPGVKVIGGPRNMAFLPHTHRALENQGYSVHRPNLPQPKAPSLEIWKERIHELLTQSRVAVAYSMGTIITLDTISEHEDIELDYLFLVGCSWGSAAYLRENQADLELLKSRMNGFPKGLKWMRKIYGIMFGESLVQKMESLESGTEIDPTKIQQQVKNIVMICSDNDRIVPLPHARRQQEKLNAELILCSNHGHFTRSKPIRQLDEFMNEKL